MPLCIARTYNDRQELYSATPQALYLIDWVSESPMAFCALSVASTVRFVGLAWRSGPFLAQSCQHSGGFPEWDGAQG